MLGIRRISLSILLRYVRANTPIPYGKYIGRYFCTYTSSSRTFYFLLIIDFILYFCFYFHFYFTFMRLKNKDMVHSGFRCMKTYIQTHISLQTDMLLHTIIYFTLRQLLPHLIKCNKENYTHEFAQSFNMLSLKRVVQYFWNVFLLQ